MKPDVCVSTLPPNWQARLTKGTRVSSGAGLRGAAGSEAALHPTREVVGRGDGQPLSAFPNTDGRSSARLGAPTIASAVKHAVSSKVLAKIASIRMLSRTNDDTTQDPRRVREPQSVEGVAKIHSAVVGVLEDGRHIVSLGDGDATTDGLSVSCEGDQPGAVVGAPSAAYLDLSDVRRPTFDIARRTILRAPHPVPSSELTAFTVEHPARFLESTTTSSTQHSTKVTETKSPAGLSPEERKQTVTLKTIVHIKTTTVTTVTKSKIEAAQPIGDMRMHTPSFTTTRRPLSAASHRSSSHHYHPRSISRPASATSQRFASNDVFGMHRRENNNSSEVPLGFARGTERSNEGLAGAEEAGDSLLRVERTPSPSMGTTVQLSLSRSLHPAAAVAASALDRGGGLKSKDLFHCHFPCGFGSKGRALSAAKERRQALGFK